MKAYSIFDDFPASSIRILEEAGIDLTILEKGKERPNGAPLKQLLDAGILTEEEFTKQKAKLLGKY